MEKQKNPVTENDLKKDAYKSQFGIIVICTSAADQRAIFEKLHALELNRELKVVCV